jgi:hypothetical protein
MEFITEVATASDPYSLLKKDPYYARLPIVETDEPHVYICNENKQVSAYDYACLTTVYIDPILMLASNTNRLVPTLPKVQIQTWTAGLLKRRIMSRMTEVTHEQV